MMVCDYGDGGDRMTVYDFDDDDNSDIDCTGL